MVGYGKGGNKVGQQQVKDQNDQIVDNSKLKGQQTGAGEKPISS